MIEKRDKRGISATADILKVVIPILFVGVIILGIFVFAFDTITDSLSVDTPQMQYSLKNATDSSLGKLNIGLLNSADWIGLALIFGLIGGMIINAFFFRGRYPKLFFIIDLLILISTLIVSVYLTNVYEILINEPILDVYKTNLPLSSTFVLKLPMIVGIVGMIVMILSYSGIPHKRKTLEGEYGY